MTLLPPPGRGIAALALLVLLPLATSRCRGLSPIPSPETSPTSFSTPAGRLEDATGPRRVPPTLTARQSELLAAYARQRQVSLPLLAAGAPADDPSAGPGAPPTAPPTVAPVAGCPGITVRSGAAVAIDGQPFRFFGVNAHYLLDDKLAEGKVDPLLAEMSARGINTIRLFYFPYHDPDRFGRLLDAGARHGIRFVVTLEDNVFKGIDWFSDDDVQADYLAHLTATVTRFRDRPEVLIWELVNEPNCGEGRYDDDCLETIRGWLGTMAERIVAIDACRPVSTGMIGDGNFENEQKSFRMANRKKGIGIVSVHRRASDEGTDELAFAEDEELPVMYGEIYDIAYDEGCGPLEGNDSPSARASRILADLRESLDDGVDGYLLWDYTAAGYCSKFGYEAGDPLWEKLRRSGDLPPPVPWR